MADRYWVGGAGTWDDLDTSHWSASSGGSSGASCPESGDDVFFDANSFPASPTGLTVTIDATVSVNNFDTTGVAYAAIIEIASYHGLTVNGNIFTVSANITMFSGVSSDVNFSGACTITINGDATGLVLKVYCSGDVPIIQLATDLIVQEFTTYNATLNTNDHNITADIFSIYTPGGGDLGSSTLQARVMEFTEPSIDFGTSEIIITVINGETAQLSAGGNEFYNVTVQGESTEATDIFVWYAYDESSYNSLIFKDPPYKVLACAGITQTCIAFDVTGTAGNLITFYSSEAGIPWTLSVGSGTVNIEYCSLKDSAATGGATFQAPVTNGCVDVSGNSGWSFDAIGGDIYDIPTAEITMVALAPGIFLPIQDVPAAIATMLARNPSYSWGSEKSRARIIFYCVLTGATDGLDDLILPIASFQATMRDGDPSYVSCVIPNSAAYEADILARTSGEILIKNGVRYADGTEQVETIARATYEAMRIDRGAGSDSVTLSGHKTTTSTSSTEYVMDGVSYYSLQNNGKRTIRASLNTFLRVGDVCIYGTGGTDYFTVDSIIYWGAANPPMLFMQVTEA